MAFWFSSTAFRFSSTAFQFSSTAFCFPRNPRKCIYGEKYTKDHYLSFVFFCHSLSHSCSELRNTCYNTQHNFCVVLILSSMKDTEWVPPNPLVDMMVANLRHQLKNIAKNLADVFLHKWPSALDITNELHRLQEAVDEYSLNWVWFSAHARVDGTVMMITTPDICRVSWMIFDNITSTLWMIVMNSIYFRKFCGLSLEVLIMPILNMRQTVWIGSL